MTAHDHATDASCAAPAGRALPAWVLVLLGLLPAIQTAVAVHLEWYPFVTYPLLKAAIIAAPVIVWLVTRRPIGRALRDIGVRRTRCGRGLILGVVFAGLILAAYYAVLRPLVDPAPIAAKARRLAVAGAWMFGALAGMISFANSLLEEYYWRGFILDEWARRFDNASPGRGRDSARLWASALGAGFFGVHHVVVLWGLVPPPLAAAGAAVTVAAGFVWSWLRLSGWSLWDCYVSHILADLACLWIGWDLIAAAA